MFRRRHQQPEAATSHYDAESEFYTQTGSKWHDLPVELTSSVADMPLAHVARLHEDLSDVVDRKITQDMSFSDQLNLRQSLIARRLSTIYPDADASSEQYIVDQRRHELQQTLMLSDRQFELYVERRQTQAVEHQQRRERRRKFGSAVVGMVAKARESLRVARRPLGAAGVAVMGLAALGATLTHSSDSQATDRQPSQSIMQEDLPRAVDTKPDADSSVSDDTAEMREPSTKRPDTKPSTAKQHHKHAAATDTIQPGYYVWDIAEKRLSPKASNAAISDEMFRILRFNGTSLTEAARLPAGTKLRLPNL